MKKYFVFVVAIIISIASIVNAEILTVDTRIGVYSVGSLVSYRQSRVSYNIPAKFNILLYGVIALSYFFFILLPIFYYFLYE